MPKKTPNLFMREAGPSGDRVNLYHWNPSRALRKRGFRGIDLWADGSPFTLEDCQAKGFADKLALYHGKKRGGVNVGRPMGPSEARRMAKQLNELAYLDEAARAERRVVSIENRRRALLIAELFDDYLKESETRVAAGERSPKTHADYAAFSAHICAWCGDMEPYVLTKELITDWLTKYPEGLKYTRGHNMAIKIGGTLRQAFRWAEGRDKWAPLLPPTTAYRDLGLGKPDERLRVGLPEEMETLLRAFDNPAELYAELETPLADRVLGPAPSMGDGLIMMLWTAARVNDALSMRDSHFETGRVIYLQSKNKERNAKICDLPILPVLAARLPAMRVRRDAERSPVERRRSNDAELIISELDGRPYWRESAKSAVRGHKPFNDRWLPYRALAGKVTPSLVGEGKDRLGRPWLAFNAQDFRDTAVSRLALATESLLEIASWHGSDLETVQKIAKHYIEISPIHADQAGEKLVAMCKKQGIAV